MAPETPHFLVFTPLCSTLFVVLRLGSVTKKPMTKSDGMSFLKLVYKKISASILEDYLSIHLYLSIFISWITFSGGNHIMSSLMERFMW